MDENNEFAERRLKLSQAKQVLLQRLLEERLQGGSAGSHQGLQRPPIVPVSRREAPPLSFAQERLWFLNQLAPDSAAYNYPIAIHLTGALDVRPLARSLDEIVRRHQVLRATFTVVDGQPVQVIAPTLAVSLPMVDLGELAESERQAELQRRIVEEAQTPFDLVEGPLLRANLLRLGRREHVVLLTIHHIVTDGWSMEILVRELATLYDAFSAGRPSPLPELPVQYTDFAHWQRQWIQGEKLESDLTYWRRKLGGSFPALELPIDRPRPAIQTFQGASQTFVLPETLTSALKALSQREGSTLFMTLLTGLKVLLYRYTGQEEIIVGTRTADRDKAETERLIGLFLNVLALRTDLSGDPSFLEALRRVREVALEAYAHQDVPFEKLVGALRPDWDPSRQPLFDVMFVLLNYPMSTMECSDLVMSMTALEAYVGAKYDLDLIIEETEGGLVGTLVYSTDLFEEATVKRMMDDFQTLLRSIAADPEQRISDLSFSSDIEQQRWMRDEVPTDHLQDREQCLHRLFETQVERTPDAVAVVFDDEQLTYGELNRRANQLARHLRAMGVKRDVVVGIGLGPSVEMIVGLLGILKAGGAYVSISPAIHPKQQLTSTLLDARVSVILTHTELLRGLPPHSAQVVCLDTDQEAIAQESAENPDNEVTADDLAYIVHTSGSTGKRVLSPHRGAVNLLHWVWAAYPFEAGETCCQKTDPSFAEAAQVIWGSLLRGSRLVVFANEVIEDPLLFLQALAKHDVTRVVSSPTLLRQILDVDVVLHRLLPGLKLWCTTGDHLSAACARRFCERLPHAVLLNHYSAAETNLVTCYDTRLMSADSSNVPIGQPIAKNQVYLLNRHLHPVPIGVPGELYIASNGLARGYLGRPDLTAERFIPNPFLPSIPLARRDEEKGSARLYRTGDLARFLPDGNIELLGRVDAQVKVRGLYINLGEIEAALNQSEAVQTAVVMGQEDKLGDRRLVAYVVSSQGQAPTAGDLDNFLKDKLPDYMLPSDFVLLDVLPLTPGGKVDRRALPDPQNLEPALEVDQVTPRTGLEEMITAVWQEVLHVEKVNVHDNFFDIGGHSLLMAQVHSRLEETLHKEILITDMFEYPTVSALSKYLEQEEVEPPTQQQIDAQAKTPVERVKQPSSEIAIIGMACRFPGAGSIDAFWQNVQDGVEAISFFTDQELESVGVETGVLDESERVKAGAIIDDVELFDASFFGFGPREAQTIDPQHRLFLECAWEAFESAGYDPEAFEGSIGVYAGSSESTYLYNLLSNRDLRMSASWLQIATGNDTGYLTTRVSYKLNLRGPSVCVQTICSTSLVAVHMACESLLHGNCDMTLAGGVSVTLPQKTGYQYQEGGMLSPDGHNRAFDAKAAGTIFGNGLGVVLLKRLEDALADRDHIYAVIKGSAVNNDGSTKVGFTAPSVKGQETVIREAQAAAGVSPETITYVEAHGTGTPLGDPVEVAALTKAFRAGTEEKQICALGSVKTNIGHLEQAAGAAGLIKTVLALEHKMIPPSLHFEEPNPRIDFANSPFYVNTVLSDWKTGDNPRRAGVSSFGMGGTNAHVILEEAPLIEVSGDSRSWQLLVLSAKTDSALETATDNLARHLKHSDHNLADIAYTLQVGRRAFDHRRIILCRDLEDATHILEISDRRRIFTGFRELPDRPVVFLFPGQGAQYVNMARDLYQEEPVFRDQVDLCSLLLMSHLGLDLRDVLYPSKDQADEAARKLRQTSYTQPAIFVVEYALAQLWMSWGVHPQAMIGHSIGEYVAACLAGVFSLEEALEIVAARGLLMQQMPAGSMLVVPQSKQEVQPLLDEELALAAVNTPSLCVASGPTEAVDELEQRLSDRGVACRRLHTSHAFHSAMMDPILELFTQQMRKVDLRAPQIPYVSNVTGTWITAAEATDASYWARQLRQTVRFAEGLGVLLKEPGQVLLEVGPGRTLSTFATRHPGRDSEQVVLSCMRHPKSDQPDMAVLLSALGRLWLAGTEVDWSAFYTHERRHRVPLPTYPFERQRYWIEAGGQQVFDVHQDQVSVDKKPDITDWFYVPSWKRTTLPQPFEVEEIAEEPRRWLVFTDGCGLGTETVERLAQAGQEVISVMAGQRFEQNSGSAYTIDPRQRDHYGTLLQALDALGKFPDTIVHLWSVTTRDQDLSEPEFLEEVQNTGFYSLLFLTQALEQQSRTDPLQMWVVSNNVQKVESTDVVHPGKATVLGACKVIPQEYPNVICHSVDLSALTLETSHWSKLVDQLVAEVRADSSDTVVAYRGRQRWVQSFEPVPLDGNVETVRLLREGGVYLITDGLTGIGWALANHLAHTSRAKLVLVEHPTFPPKDSWEEWLAAHDEKDGVSKRIQKVLTLENLGAEVLALGADVADESEMRDVVARAIERFGEIHGVIHAAGSVGDKLFMTIQEIDPTEHRKLFAPKVQGSIVLEEVLQDRNLDFCLLISSLSSILGGVGYTIYASANSFMDAFVSRHNETNQSTWISVNWDVWKFEDGEEHIVASNAELSRLAMISSEGVEAFRRILAMGTAHQIVVSTGDLPARIERWVRPGSPQQLARSKKPEMASTLNPRPDLPNAYTTPASELERTIAKVWQEVLGIQQVGVYDNFFELGGDSIIAIQAISRLKRELKLEMPAVSLYQRPTIRDLAELLEQDEDRATKEASARLAERREAMLRRRQRQQQRRSRKR